MVLRVYFLITIHDKKRTPNIRQLESSIAISASCNLNPSHLKNICKKWWYDVHRWYSPTLSDYIVWEVSLLQNKKLSLVRYATVDERIIMHWLRSSIIQSMGANHKTSPTSDLASLGKLAGCTVLGLEMSAFPGMHQQLILTISSNFTPDKKTSTKSCCGGDSTLLC